MSSSSLSALAAAGGCISPAQAAAAVGGCMAERVDTSTGSFYEGLSLIGGGTMLEAGAGWGVDRSAISCGPSMADRSDAEYSAVGDWDAEVVAAGDPLDGSTANIAQAGVADVEAVVANVTSFDDSIRAFFSRW